MGGWVQNTNGVPWTLYRLPELLATDGTVYVVEGEKDVETLRARGYVATCNRAGAGKANLTDWGPINGRHCVVIADKDSAEKKYAGQRHAIDVCAILGGSPLECTRGKDISDHFAAGGTIDELVPMAAVPAALPEPTSAVRERTELRIKEAPPVKLPEIPIGTDIERMTNQAIDAIAADSRTYQRGGFLAGVIRVPEGPAKIERGVKRSPGSYVIVTLDKATVKERLSTVACWLKHDGRSDKHKEALPCDDAVSALIARKQWDKIRNLVGVVTAPQLRPDGTVLQEPGYDEATGLLYEPSEDFPSVSEHPKIADARGALETIREVVCDFPFARAEYESAWIAGLLTMLARAAILGAVPLFAVDATTRGTGKSRLVDAASVIVHGRHSARTSLPDEDDEMRKRITSLVLDGDPMVCLDNITKPIILPSLDAVLTSTVWKDRMLGKNATITAPHRTVWWATGNNLVLGGDISRRSIHIRLESSLENPEERTGFRHPNLLEWVERERRRLVVAGLTLLRSYVLENPPYQGGLWGSFEEWSRLVCGAIVWAGGTDPLIARATQDPALDDEKRALTVLIDGLNRLCPSDPGLPVRPLSAKAIISALYPERDLRDGPPAPDGYDDLRDAIEQETRTPTGRTPEARRLGKWLQRVRGRVIGGWCIHRHEGANHSACWRAEPSGA